MKHIDGEWKRYYLDAEIIDQPIIDLTTLDLKNWARNKIVSNHMTKKQYYNMAIIIRQSLNYLVELGELPVNHFAEFKINSSLFTPPKPREAAERVFIEDEEKKLKQIALQDFEEYPEHIGATAVLINLSLGLRVSELVALQWKDLKDGYLQIRRMEQKQWGKTYRIDQDRRQSQHQLKGCHAMGRTPGREDLYRPLLLLSIL